MKPIDYETTTFAAHPPSLNKLLLTRCNIVLAGAGHDASFKSLQEAMDCLAAIGISEIIADMACGRQPWDAPDFGALHDHTDANCYAMLCEEGWACVVPDCEVEDGCKPDDEIFVQIRYGIATYVQEIMAQWMLDTLELRQSFADTINDPFAHLDAETRPLATADVWGNHPTVGRATWEHDVISGNTNLGYWEYVSHSLEAEQGA